MTGSNVVQPSLGQQVIFEWRLDLDTDEKEAKKLADTLQSSGGEVHFQSRPEGLFPIPVVIFGAVIAVALVEQVTDWWTNRKKSGIMIQAATDGKVSIQPINAPYGAVIFIGADGNTCEYQNVSKDQMKDILTSVSQVGGNTAQNRGKTPK